MSTHCYLVIIRREGDHYVAESLDLPGCTATGATFEEAHHNITETMKARVRRLQEAGLLIPESLDFEDYHYSWPELSNGEQTGLAILFHV